MAIPANELHQMIQAQFPDAEIAIEDLRGDGDHYRVIIESDRFAGLTRIQQHQMVYAALDGKMGGELHAMSLQTSPKS
ncbi:MAG: BolA family transcriptional regulator [Micavibrio sp.]|nr:BolA family transcriptional regulator [Micavibrio sp.]|tara:strand:- start:739917 stop:740150 length:234 start_codon:yes stop_codon:yes gene_type:complete